MPTNEERKEIAEKLRDMADCEYISDSADFGLVIKRAFREAVPIPRSDRAFLRTIADLIEPERSDETQTAQYHLVSLEKITGETWKPERTCRMVKPEWAGPKSRTKVCSGCGVQFRTWLEKYCSHCGARVVE